MNEDVFNASLRGFLKKVGITSQREIEKAVRDAIEAGKLKGNEKLPAKMVLTIGGVASRMRSPTRSSWVSTHHLSSVALCAMRTGAGDPVFQRNQFLNR